jgi:hypothetical protein
VRCEDFPCCGHTIEDGCPDPALIADGFLPYPCIDCGGLIKKGDAPRGHESFHKSCFSKIDWEGRGWMEDFDGFEDETKYL